MKWLYVWQNTCIFCTCHRQRKLKWSNCITSMFYSTVFVPKSSNNVRKVTTVFHFPFHQYRSNQFTSEFGDVNVNNLWSIANKLTSMHSEIYYKYLTHIDSRLLHVCWIYWFRKSVYITNSMVMTSVDRKYIHLNCAIWLQIINSLSKCLNILFIIILSLQILPCN